MYTKGKGSLMKGNHKKVARKVAEESYYAPNILMEKPFLTSSKSTIGLVNRSLKCSNPEYK